MSRQLLQLRRYFSPSSSSPFSAPETEKKSPYFRPRKKICFGRWRPETAFSILLFFHFPFRQTVGPIKLSSSGLRATATAAADEALASVEKYLFSPEKKEGDGKTL